MANKDKDCGGFLNDDRQQVSKLEKALAGQPVETILRVRDYARTFDVDDDDEIFALMAAFKFLMVLVEDAPEKWQALFDEVLQDLENWAERNQQAFRELKSYAAAANELSGTLEQAILGIDKANVSRRSLKQEVLEAIADNADLDRQFAKALGERLNKTDKKIEAIQAANRVTGRVAIGGVVASVVVLLVGGVTSMRLLGQNQELRQALIWQQTRTGWLVDKANRAECFYGIKPQSDPQCQE